MKKKNNDYYDIFKPELTPKRMMELGVFGGSYFGLNVKEYPKIWFKNVKISKTFDVCLFLHPKSPFSQFFSIAKTCLLKFFHLLIWISSI